MSGERGFTLRPDRRPELMLATLGTVAVAGGVAARVATTVGPIAAEAAEAVTERAIDDAHERRLRREIARNRAEDTDAGDDETAEPRMDAEEIRDQLLEAFDGADEPVRNRIALWRALPDGLGTTFSSNGVTFTARELNERTDGKADFPYATVEDLVDDLVAGMRRRGHVA